MDVTYFILTEKYTVYLFAISNIPICHIKKIWCMINIVCITDSWQW